MGKRLSSSIFRALWPKFKIRVVPKSKFCYAVCIYIHMLNVEIRAVK